MPDKGAIERFQELFLPHAPTRHARMNRPGSSAKYHTVHAPIGTREIRAHLAGRLTVAAPLIGPAGLAWAAALDVDHGGIAALWQLLLRARHGGYSAFAVSSSAGHHDGGHVWLLFDAPAVPERLRRCAEHLVTGTGIAAELYPGQRTLRLPLGVHRGSGRRGTLLLPDGGTLDLDRERGAVGLALRLLAALPRNAAGSLPELPPPPPAPPARIPASCAASDRIAAFNGSIDLLTLLEHYGGRVVQRLSHGGLLMRCPCPGHAHGDGRPSLELRPARSPRRGRFVAVGHAPACLFAADAGEVVDAFSAFCRWEGVTPAEAIQRLSLGAVTRSAVISEELP